MHTLLLKLLAALVALLLLSAAPALANVDRPMQSHPSPDTLAGQCSANGGSFHEETQLGIHMYGCDKQNCDGKGGTCSVNCGDKGCTGSTPAIIVNANIRMILQNGSLVNHLYAPDDGSATPSHDPGTPAPAGVPGAPSFL
jgi:hypothetical protein